jgi:hypothetical protein
MTDEDVTPEAIDAEIQDTRIDYPIRAGMSRTRDAYKAEIERLRAQLAANIGMRGQMESGVPELATLRAQVAQLNLELECRKIILQPSDGWMFYRDGVYGPATEKELRDFSFRLGVFSDQKGIASVVMQQMWAEIDKLRAFVTQAGDAMTIDTGKS